MPFPSDLPLLLGPWNRSTGLPLLPSSAWWLKLVSLYCVWGCRWAGSRQQRIPPNADSGGPIPPRLPIPPTRPTVTLVPCGTGSACLCSLWSFLSPGLRVLCAGLKVLTTDCPLCPPALAFQDQGQLHMGSGRNAWDLGSVMVQCGAHMAHCKQPDRSRF